MYVGGDKFFTGTCDGIVTLFDISFLSFALFKVVPKKSNFCSISEVLWTHCVAAWAFRRQSSRQQRQGNDNGKHFRQDPFSLHRWKLAQGFYYNCADLIDRTFKCPANSSRHAKAIFLAPIHRSLTSENGFPSAVRTLTSLKYQAFHHAVN